MGLQHFPMMAFSVPLGFAGHASMWKDLAATWARGVLSESVNWVLWCVSISCTAACIASYALKMVRHINVVRAEYADPVRVNFFFMPHLILLMLAIGCPARRAGEQQADIVGARALWMGGFVMQASEA